MIRQLLFGPLLLVYQMPKTGSQTIEATLRNCGLPDQILRFHFLSPQLAEKVRESAKSAPVAGPLDARTSEQLALCARLPKVLRLRNLLRRCRVRIPKIRAVSALRDPIGLALACAFENYAAYFSGPGSDSLARCRQELLKPREHKFVRQWFDLELKAMLGIDVYQTPFPRQKGYAIYENALSRVLVYRFEALACLPVMLGEFLGREIPEIVSRNVGDSKQYGEAYRYVKQNLRLPGEFVADQCDGKMMRHFYSEAERRSFETRWSESGANVAQS